MLYIISCWHLVAHALGFYAHVLYKRCSHCSNDLFSFHEGMLSVVTVGELRRGVELIRYRGDVRQANQLEKWLDALMAEYQDYILDINQDIAQLWGRLRAPNPENALDKQIAATALIYELTVVTRNHKDCVKTGVRALNTFTE